MKKHDNKKSLTKVNIPKKKHPDLKEKQQQELMKAMYDKR